MEKVWQGKIAYLDILGRRIGRSFKMDKIDLVVRICKNIDSLNGFYKVCERYELTIEQIQQALALLNNRTKVPERS